MIQGIYAIFDDKAEAFMPPFYQSTEGLAIRVFADATRKDDHPFYENPEDYHLYKLGEFNDQNGAITTSKKLLMSALEIKAASDAIATQQAKLNGEAHV